MVTTLLQILQKSPLKNKVKELFEGFEGEREGDSFKSEGVF